MKSRTATAGIVVATVLRFSCRSTRTARGAGARTGLRVTVDAGADDVVRPAAAGVLAALRRVHTGPFTVDSCSIEDSDALVLDPAVVDDLWMGAGRRPVTFRATAPEYCAGERGPGPVIPRRERAARRGRDARRANQARWST